MRKVFLLLFTGLLAVTFATASVTYAGTTEVVSVDSNGKLANGYSYAPAISTDGRFVAFYSAADNLVPNDTNGFEDVFVHDRQTGATEIISGDRDGTQADRASNFPSISADGRLVAFQSAASNLVPDDTNEMTDIFVHDRKTGTTEIVSKGGDGILGNNNSYEPNISADGRFVVFQSEASNLIPDDTNDKPDVFVHDRKTGTTEIVSKDSNGIFGNNYSYEPNISADGRFVAFWSGADNLVPDDINGKPDVFVHDRKTGKTEIVSKDSDGNLGDNRSYEPAISADGRFVAFRSGASNLVPGDTNGKTDIFVHDRKTGATEIVSKDSDGNLGDNDSYDPSISDDGRYVIFASEAGNLVQDDTNGKADAFVYDRQTGATEIVSVDSAGVLANDGECSVAVISANGRYAAFESNAGNLVPDDTNGKSDIFVRVRE